MTILSKAACRYLSFLLDLFGGYIGYKEWLNAKSIEIQDDANCKSASIVLLAQSRDV